MCSDYKNPNVTTNSHFHSDIIHSSKRIMSYELRIDIVKLNCIGIYVNTPLIVKK